MPQGGDGRLMKDSSLKAHAIRKMHDWHASVWNKMLPLKGLSDSNLPEPELIQPESRELLPHTLEDQFYGRNLERGDVIESYPARRFIFHKVDVVGDQGLVFPGKRQVVTIEQTKQQIPISRMRRPIRLLRQDIHSPLFHMTGNNHDSHGHFVLQHLPRLMVVRDELLANLEIKLMLAPGHGRWQKFYLKKLGFGSDRWVECTRGTIQCKRLLFIPQFFNQGCIHARFINQSMRELFVGNTPRKPLRDLFLSRKKAPHRQLLNEDMIFHECKKIWPEMKRIELSDFSPGEQVKLFACARVVIGPFGQSFTNLIYSKSALAIVLLAGDSVGGFSAGFRNLAIQLGGDGVVMTAGMKEHNSAKFDWSYPLNRLRGQLARLQELLPDKYR